MQISAWPENFPCNKPLRRDLVRKDLERSQFDYMLFYYKQRFFSTQPQCCLIFSWIELQMLLRCCLIHISIIILRHFLYLLYLCPCLDLGLFMSYLLDLFSILIFIFIMFNRVFSWVQANWTHIFSFYF